MRDVHGTLHMSLEARILNMSMTGMAVATGEKLPVGRKHGITFRCGGDTTLRLEGSVVWCRLREHDWADGRGTAPAYEAGFRFEHTLGQRAADLARVLQAASLTEVSKRISGRFKVEMEEPVSLGTALGFTARNLSASGILVETDGLPSVGTVVDTELRYREYALRTRGRIARIHKTDGARGGQPRQFGLEFVETSEDGREAIRRFVSRCIERPADGAAG